MNVEEFIETELSRRDSRGIWFLAADFLNALVGYCTDDDDIGLLETSAKYFEDRIDNYDPTPMHQWEVTEGISERERWEMMLKKMEGTR